MRVLLKFVHALKKILSSQFLSLLASLLIVVATGVVIGVARVELASPFTARQDAVQIVFYDDLTGEHVDPNAIQLLLLTSKKRLGYMVEIYRLKPNFLGGILQSLLAWFSLWLAMGFSLWLIKRSLKTAQWWQIGFLTGLLMVWRFLQALSVSHWLWLPDWRPDFVVALLDIVQGHSVQAPLVWGILWRGTIWLLTGLATFIHIFWASHRIFELSHSASFFNLLLTYIVSKIVYFLSTGQLWR
ncbi:MAG: hypothetical protein NZ937_07690 [Armatimonadetes bacterium]|nr:hypothetical protein [Armatimonadota bacterium]